MDKLLEIGTYLIIIAAIAVILDKLGNIYAWLIGFIKRFRDNENR